MQQGIIRLGLVLNSSSVLFPGPSVSPSIVRLGATRASSTWWHLSPTLCWVSPQQPGRRSWSGSLRWIMCLEVAVEAGTGTFRWTQTVSLNSSDLKVRLVAHYSSIDPVLTQRRYSTSMKMAISSKHTSKFLVIDAAMDMYKLTYNNI